MVFFRSSSSSFFLGLSLEIAQSVVALGAVARGWAVGGTQSVVALVAATQSVVASMVALAPATAVRSMAALAPATAVRGLAAIELAAVL